MNIYIEGGYDNAIGAAPHMIERDSGRVSLCARRLPSPTHQTKDLAPESQKPKERISPPLFLRWRRHSMDTIILIVI